MHKRIAIQCIMIIIFKFIALCMANMQINGEMHKYSIKYIQNNGWVQAGNRGNQKDTP